MAKGEGVLPEYEGKSTEKLWEEFESYHEVDAKKGVNKPQERERRIRHHRKPLTQIIEETLGKDSEGKSRESLDHIKSEAEKKRHAAAIVTKIAHEHYKTDDKDAKKPNEDKIRQFLQLSGANVTYEDLLKHIMDLPDLRYDQLPEQSPLRRVIDYTSLYKVPEGRKIEILRQYLSRPEHREGLAKLLGAGIGREFKPTADADDMFAEHRARVTEEGHNYILKRETTYARPKKGGGH